ncbi:MAG: phytochelatin synthase family protein, partial [Deltaproteobacteria bacterium]|nr:phytochelatin synthase family protein [Kofleriaceae bacterium]
METLYRRPLPGDAIAFASPEGQRLFGEALAAGGLGGYFALAEQYQTQSDPAFCGLGSLVVALNALAIDPGRLWKGPWRWYSEELLDCCVSLEQVRAQGVDLDTLACLARCNGAEATVVRPADDDAGIDDLRRAVVRASAGPGEVLIAAYDRKLLEQTGAGHFSPIGGYHAASDQVLVLDVARFKYPPHWVALPRLAVAMRTTDPTTGRLRGALLLRRREGHHGIMLSLACAGDSMMPW